MFKHISGKQNILFGSTQVSNQMAAFGLVVDMTETIVRVWCLTASESEKSLSV